ncbi:hypothetical protein [Streptosporangium sp. NPDC002721]|uniref:hypothetical protein n=1 Tax=Streptosporangium sp. NPDC002721 TaxID=3366188 RepID=UPI0036BEAF6D
MATKKCQATFIARDGNESVTCDRDGRHLVHRESSTNTTAVRVPGGALITKPTK